MCVCVCSCVLSAMCVQLPVMQEDPLELELSWL